MQLRRARRTAEAMGLDLVKLQKHLLTLCEHHIPRDYYLLKESPKE